VVAAASFNGGRSQTGLNPLQTGGEYAFLNVVKTCQDWGYASAPNKDGALDPSLLDENGYPTSIQTGGYYAVCYVPLSWVGQSLTVQWDGGGTIKVPGGSPVGSQTSSNGSTNNSITCTCVDQRIAVGAVATNASPNHVKNIRVSLTGTETTLLNSGEVFRPEFKNKLTEAGFGVLRFMDWHANNTTNVTDWASRKPTTYFSYSAPEWRNVTVSGRSKLYCGNTTSSGNAYSITGNGEGVPASGVPVHMQKIQLHFDADATQSGTCTLDLNGTGAKSILSWWGEPLSPGANSYPQANYFTNPTYGTMVFDSGLDAWLLMGAQQAWGSQGIINGVPPEICLQLAAEVGAHAWFVSPRFALDAPTDYVPSLAAYCRANAPSWMVPRFETPNETFNTGNAGFHNGVYGRNKANVRWGSLDQKMAHGYWASILGQAVAAAYGVAQSETKTQSMYHLVNGVQTVSGTSTSNYNQHMTSAAYTGQAAAAPTGYSKAVGVAEAWRWTTHLAVAQYFTPCDYGSAEETAAVAAYQTASAAVKNDLLDNYLRGLTRTNGGGSPYTATLAQTNFSGWKTWALSFSVNKMCGYEGGYSPDYTGGGTSNTDLFRHACKSRPLAADYLAMVFQGFVGLSDDTFTAEFPSTFMTTDFTYGTTVTNFAWTLLSGDIQSSNTPQFDFIVRFNKGRRAISPRLRFHG